MWGNQYCQPINCVYCKKEIDGCCYPAYEGTVKIGYRHLSCYPEQATQPKDYVEKTFGEVTNQNGEEID